MILLQKIVLVVLVVFLVQWLAIVVWRFRRGRNRGDLDWAITGGFFVAALNTILISLISAAIWFIIFG